MYLFVCVCVCVCVYVCVRVCVHGKGVSTEFLIPIFFVRNKAKTLHLKLVNIIAYNKHVITEKYAPREIIISKYQIFSSIGPLSTFFLFSTNFCYKFFFSGKPPGFPKKKKNFP